MNLLFYLFAEDYIWCWETLVIFSYTRIIICWDKLENLWNLSRFHVPNMFVLHVYHQKKKGNHVFFIVFLQPSCQNRDRSSHNHWFLISPGVSAVVTTGFKKRSYDHPELGWFGPHDLWETSIFMNHSPSFTSMPWFTTTINQLPSFISIKSIGLRKKMRKTLYI